MVIDDIVQQLATIDGPCECVEHCCAHWQSEAGIILTAMLTRAPRLNLEEIRHYEGRIADLRISAIGLRKERDRAIELLKSFYQEDYPGEQREIFERLNLEGKT